MAEAQKNSGKRQLVSVCPLLPLSLQPLWAGTKSQVRENCFPWGQNMFVGCVLTVQFEQPAY